MNMFETLPDADQQTIINLCREHTYDKVVGILAQPRPLGLSINTSVSSLCRFYTSWNPEAKQARLMEQFGKTLRVRRQATPGAAITGILAILENNLLNQLSRGKAVADLAVEFNTYIKAHRAWLSEEKNNHALGEFDSRRDYWKHLELISGGLDEDFDHNDQPREDGLAIQSADDFTPEDQDREDVELLVGSRSKYVHIPLDAESHRRHIVNRRPVPNYRRPASPPSTNAPEGSAEKSGEISEKISAQPHAISLFSQNKISP